MTSVAASLPPVVWRTGQFIITGALLIMLWHAADGPGIARTLADAQPGWIMAAVVALICQTLLSACRWKVTAAALGQRLSLPMAVREYFMAQAVNQSLPGGFIGDAARAVRARSAVGLAVSGLAVGMERLAGQIAMFAVLSCSFIVTYLWEGGLDWPRSYAAVIGLMIGVAILATLFVLILRGRLRDLQPTASRWVDMAMRALFSRDVLPAQVGLGVMITLCNLAAFGFCGWAVGQPLSFAALFAIVPLILFTMLIPLTVSGWGVREGSAAILLPLAGIPMTEAVATSVLFGIAMLLGAIPGFAVMVMK